jgi:uncharacterized protein
MRAPEIYIEETQQTPHVIHLRSQSHAVFIGPTRSGPVGEPVRVTSAGDAARLFMTGPPLHFAGEMAPSHDHMALATQLFFENGGEILTIVRVAGVDGARPAVADYLGTGALIGGLDALTDIHDIGLLAAPGLTDHFRQSSDVLAVQQAMLTFVERRGCGFVVLSGARGADVASSQRHRRAFSSSFGALYVPWVELADGQWTSPCGAVAGCIARRDREVGVTAAPAGLDVRGIRGVSETLDTAQRSDLTLNNVNVIGALPGRGIRVQSARTLSPLVDWRFIPVRRFLGAIAQAVSQDLRWAVFEPNGEPLWADIRQTLTNFCMACWRDGMLVGNTPAEAFYVRCDRTTMTEQDVIDGRLHALVGVAALRPSEFHVIRETLIVQPPPVG